MMITLSVPSRKVPKPDKKIAQHLTCRFGAASLSRPVSDQQISNLPSVFPLLQVPGQLHGGRPWRRHARLPTLGGPSHHPPAQGAHAHARHLQVRNNI